MNKAAYAGMLVFNQKRGDGFALMQHDFIQMIIMHKYHNNKIKNRKAGIYEDNIIKCKYINVLITNTLS